MFVEVVLATGFVPAAHTMVFAERCTAFLTNFMSEGSVFKYLDMLVRPDALSARYSSRGHEKSL
jgi:hypothetical protein